MELWAMTACELRNRLASGEVSAEEVTTAHLERVARVNSDVNAVVDLRADSALEQACAADRAAAAGENLPPLHGLPVVIKDTAHAQGFVTTHGSRAHAGEIAEQDELHVARMRAAGAVVLGKSNVPEYAAGSNTNNRVYGQTHNPYDLSKVAGGSSGGAAAALATGMAALADGSDMGGSLRNPAALCNVVGLRPTPGLVPDTSSNVFTPLATLGPMGRTPEDVALLLSVISGPDVQDPTADIPRTSRRLDAVDLKGLRVAVAPDLGGRVRVDPELVAGVRAAADALSNAGAHVVEAMPNLDGSDHAFRTLRSAEFFAAFGEDLDQGKEEFVHFLADNIEQGRNLSAADVFHAQEEHTRLVRQAGTFFQDVDLFLAPTTSIPAPSVDQDYPAEFLGQASLDYLDWMAATWLFTPLNIPALSLPGGFTEAGLPFGLHLMAAHGRDHRLLSMAGAVRNVLPDFSAAPLDLLGAPGPIKAGAKA
jgi:amidase